MCTFEPLRELSGFPHRNLVVVLVFPKCWQGHSGALYRINSLGIHLGTYLVPNCRDTSLRVVVTKVGSFLLMWQASCFFFVSKRRTPTQTLRGVRLCACLLFAAAMPFPCASPFSSMPRKEEAPPRPMS